MKKTLLSLALLASLGAQAQWAPPIFATTIQSQGPMTSGGKITGNNGMSISNGVTQLHNTEVNLTGSSKLIVNGPSRFRDEVQMEKDLLMNAKKVKGLAAGTDGTDAVNVNQLTTEAARLDKSIENTNKALNVERVDRIAAVNNNAATAANATAAVQTNLNTERDARIAGDVATLNAANHYTDSKSGADRAYTDKAVAAESNRAQAAEAALSKETKQVGAMAMAAAGVAGATPQGDKQTAVTAAVGAYSGQTAIAVGVTRLVGEGAKIFGAFSKVSGGKTGVTVGASFSF